MQFNFVVSVNKIAVPSGRTSALRSPAPSRKASPLHFCKVDAYIMHRFL